MRLRDQTDVYRDLLRDLLEDYSREGCGRALHEGRPVCARCATPWPCGWERARRALALEAHHGTPRAVDPGG